MVCPLRFIVVGVSAVIAVLIAFNMDWGRAKELEPEDDLVEAVESTRIPLPKSMFEMLTGKYLYNVYTAWKAHGSGDDKKGDYSCCRERRLARTAPAPPTS